MNPHKQPSFSELGPFGVSCSRVARALAPPVALDNGRLNLLPKLGTLSRTSPALVCRLRS
jgi:hypothetical protein